LEPKSTPGPTRRALIGLAVLAAGLGVQAALEASYRTERPSLARPLASLPMHLGRWVGHDEPMDPDVLHEAQCDDHLNRTYEDPDRPGRSLRLWINYSKHGLNLRHSPEICLPSGGWTKIEAQTRALPVERPGRAPVTLMRLAYAQADVVQGVGFWYYIFGEGPLEHFARTLPIASRSSHGRTTRGSGLTVEVFCPGESDPDGEALREFAAALLDALEPILPKAQDQYYIP
jgi:EpsI family protein